MLPRTPASTVQMLVSRVSAGRSWGQWCFMKYCSINPRDSIKKSSQTEHRTRQSTSPARARYSHLNIPALLRQQNRCGCTNWPATTDDSPFAQFVVDHVAKCYAFLLQSYKCKASSNFASYILFAHVPRRQCSSYCVPQTSLAVPTLAHLAYKRVSQFVRLISCSYSCKIFDD